MGYVAVIVIALLVLSAGDSQLRWWEFVRFIVLAIPLNFGLTLVGGWLLGKIASARYGPASLQDSAEISPELVAQTARDPVFNAAKFLLWSGKWVAVIGTGLWAAR